MTLRDQEEVVTEIDHTEIIKNVESTKEREDHTEEETEKIDHSERPDLTVKTELVRMRPTTDPQEEEVITTDQELPETVNIMKTQDQTEVVASEVATEKKVNTEEKEEPPTEVVRAEVLTEVAKAEVATVEKAEVASEEKEEEASEAKAEAASEEKEEEASEVAKVATEVAKAEVLSEVIADHRASQERATNES